MKLVFPSLRVFLFISLAAAMPGARAANQDVWLRKKPTSTGWENAEKRFDVDPRGGTVLRIPGFDLRKPGAEWDGDGRFRMVHEEDESGLGSYRLMITSQSEGKWTDW